MTDTTHPDSQALAGKHTPIPWYRKNIVGYVFGPDCVVARCGYFQDPTPHLVELNGDRWNADADLIVEAVNSHEIAKNIVNEQAEDESLWFRPERITEDILQKALRRLHEAVEGKTQEQCAKEFISSHAADKALIEELEQVIRQASELSEALPELNNENYDHDDVVALNNGSIELCLFLRAALEKAIAKARAGGGL